MHEVWGHPDRRRTPRLGPPDRDEDLLAWAIRRTAIASSELGRIRQRHTLYGGAMDTILLELGLLPESTLLCLLGEVTGLFPATDEHIREPDLDVARLMEPAIARRLQAVAVRREGENLELVGSPRVDLDAATSWTHARDLSLSVFVASEVRFEALVALVFDRPLAPRFDALLTRLDGSKRARASSQARRATQDVRPPRVETGPQTVVPVAITRSPVRPSATDATSDVFDLTAFVDLDDEGHVEDELGIDVDDTVETPEDARARVATPSEPAKVAVRMGETAQPPAAVVLEPRSTPRLDGAIPSLIARLGRRRDAETEAARAALVKATCQDFGPSRRRWQAWWKRHGHADRDGWLIDALLHPRADLRLAAWTELKPRCDRYLGYHVDLYPKDREDAVRRVRAWWQKTRHRALPEGES